MPRIAHLSMACLLATAVFVTVTRASGDTPLIKAVKANDVAGVRTLIKSGASVNAKAGDGSTALLWAANNGSVEIARAGRSEGNGRHSERLRHHPVDSGEPRRQRRDGRVSARRRRQSVARASGR